MLRGMASPSGNMMTPKFADKFILKMTKETKQAALGKISILTEQLSSLAAPCGKSYFWLGVIFFTLGGCGDTKPPQTVIDLDLGRYAGKWYEVASFPNRFQKGCVGSTATYILKKSHIDVVNECYDQSFQGKKRSAEGKAWVAKDYKTPSKLRVRFFWPFSGDYWVIGLDDKYEWALVGDPRRRYLWVLSRNPILQPEIYQKILFIATQQGFDTSKLVKTKQNNH